MHHVLISYSKKDKKWANAACSVLEARGLRCWIAPRDIVPGTEWGAAIVEAIDACSAMVLIFSSAANASPQVRREVERALTKGRTLVPCRVEDVRPEGAMEYALSNTHWLDIFTPPVQRQMQRLADSVEALLRSDPVASKTLPQLPIAPIPSSWRERFRGRVESLATRARLAGNSSGKPKLLATAGLALFLVLGTIATLVFWSPKNAASTANAVNDPDVKIREKTESPAKSPDVAMIVPPIQPGPADSPGPRQPGGNHEKAAPPDIPAQDLSRLPPSGPPPPAGRTAPPAKGERPGDGRDSSTVRVFHGHSAPIRRLLFTPDGSRLISASMCNWGEVKRRVVSNEVGRDNTLRVWDVGSGQQIRKFVVREGIGYGPQDIALSADARLLAAGTGWDWGRDSKRPGIFVWDLATGIQKYHFLFPDTLAMRAVGFSADGGMLYAAKSGVQVHSWSMLEGREWGIIELQDQYTGKVPVSTRFTAGCRYVLSTCWHGKTPDGFVRLWDRETGKLLKTLKGPDTLAIAVAMSPDGTHILATGRDCSVEMWETDSGRQVFSLTNIDSAMHCVEFSPDGTRFATGAEDGSVSVFDVATRKQVARFSGHTENVKCVAFSPNGRLLASGGDDTTIRLWQLP